MVNIKLNKSLGETVLSHGYELRPEQEYCICLSEEMKTQTDIFRAVHLMGLPALDDYYTWLNDNGFDLEAPNPTNSLVSSYYGTKPLWVTDLSQGIVVKAQEDDDFYIVMECSRLNEGFKYTQIILTPGGCM